MRLRTLFICALGAGAASLTAAAPAFAEDQKTFSRMCGEYRRMMDDDDHRIGMRNRFRRWWYGDGRDQRRGYGYGAARRFSTIDGNHDGVVSAEEASANVEAVFAAMNNDNDEQLAETEFMSVRMGRGGGRNKERQAANLERRKVHFAEMDIDKDAKLSKSEFFDAGRKRFAAADADQDGKVTPWEFRSHVRSAALRGQSRSVAQARPRPNREIYRR